MVAVAARPPAPPVRRSTVSHPSPNVLRGLSFVPQPNPKEIIMFVPYYPDLLKVADEMNVEILESYVPDSRLHQIINNPYTEGIDEG
jgi:hypothetical protein